MGDSYGIHEAQQQGNSMANYVNDYNSQVRAHNQSAHDQYMKVKNNASSTKDLLDAHEGGLTAWDGLNGLHGAFQTYKATQKYQGLGNAFARGTQENLFSMTGGKYGAPAMGPNEAATRGVQQGQYDLTSGAKKVASSIQEGAESVNQKTKLMGLQGERQQSVAKFNQNSGLGSSYDNTATQGSAKGTVSATVGEAQEKDRQLGIGWSAENQTDATKSMTQLGEDAKVGASDEGLGLQAKVLKKGLVAAGIDKGVAHTLGKISGGVVGAGMGIETAVSDFSGKDDAWSKMNTTQKVGQGFDMVSDAMSVADTFVPELTPFTAIVGGIGAALDIKGGDDAESKKVSTAQSTDSSSQQKTISAPSERTTTATTTAPTSLQKVSQASSSSY